MACISAPSVPLGFAPIQPFPLERAVRGQLSCWVALAVSAGTCSSSIAGMPQRCARATHRCNAIGVRAGRAGSIDSPGDAFTRLWRQLRWQLRWQLIKLRQLSSWQFYAVLFGVVVIMTVAANFFVQAKYWAQPSASSWSSWGHVELPWTSHRGWFWRWRRSLRLLWREIARQDFFFPLAAIGLCALGAVARQSQAASLSARPVRTKRTAAVQRPRRQPATVSVNTLGLTKSEAAEAKLKAAYEKLRQDVQRGNEFAAALDLEDWIERRAHQRPPTRRELQTLLEDIATVGRRYELLRLVVKALEKAGVPLDWADGYDCSANFGRYALDAALDAAVNQSRDERGALLLLDLGLRSGTGSTQRLNAGPLLRSAAMHGMVKLIDRLVSDAGADVNILDPRASVLARSPLCCAVQAGQEAAALRLLDLGAGAPVGADLDLLLRRATPKLRARLALSTQPRPFAASELASNSSATLLAEVRGHLKNVNVDAAANALDASVEATDALSRAERQVLLEDAVRYLAGGRSSSAAKLVRRFAADIERTGITLDWPPGSDSSQGYGRLPLDAALQAAVGEAGDDDLACLILDLGLNSGNGSVNRLNVGPLLRSAAAQNLPKFVRRLVEDCGADVDAVDPRFGSVALDRAVDSGAERVALELLRLGADPAAGRGVEYLLERASPRVRSEVRRAI